MKYKISVGSICILFLIIIAQFQSVEASNIANIHAITPTSYTHTGTVNNPSGGVTWFHEQPIERIVLEDGSNAFCIEPWYFINGMEGYTKEPHHNEVLSKIIYHGYVNTARTNYDYAITQLMVWELYSYTPLHTVENYEQQKQKIQNAITMHDVLPSFANQSYNIDVNETLSLYDENQVLQSIKPSLSIPGCTYTIEANTLHITPSTSAQEQIVVSMQKYPESTNAVSYLYKKSGSQSVYRGELQDTQAFEFSMDVRTHVDVVVRKVSTFATKSSSLSLPTLEGAKYGLFNNETEELVQTQSIDAENKLTFENVSSKHTYYVQELVAPEGYLINNEKMEVDPVSLIASKTYEYELLSLEDIITGVIQIHKTIDNTSQSPGVGFTFHIYDENNNLVGEMQTNEKGIATSNPLPYGKYVVKEVVEYPFIQQDDIEVMIDTHEKVYTFTLMNEVQKGTFSFLKEGNVFTSFEPYQQDGFTLHMPITTKHYLAGSTISIFAKEDIVHNGSIYYSKDEKVHTMTSQVNAVSSIPLPLGSYYYIEETSPLGYVPDTTQYSFEITKNNEIVSSTLYNKQQEITIQLLKTLEQDTFSNVTSDAYRDVRFAIYTKTELFDQTKQAYLAADSMIHLCEIDAQGQLIAPTYLPYGQYYLQEVVSNDAYVLDATKYDFEVNATTTIIELQDNMPIVNKLKDYDFNILKIDANTKQIIPSSIVKFHLYADEACTSIIQSLDIDNHGNIPFTLHSGTYYVKEIQQPKGYAISDEVIQIKIEDNQVYVQGKLIEANASTYEIPFENQPLHNTPTSDTSKTRLYLSMVVLSLWISILVVRFKIYNK